ncbi:phosphoglycerate dehydrogenase [Helicobacter mustelae]|uniref:D-3-phosphoglycerate dehydrogenase n=1 Tax=Helicobacter mustelae (strain ATCC 43772 / CCUG 25715 / CIP 103759 / LMG 18044 / NCTC 12198 / R85-136P) TaxID=679897 RepID=D3UFZ6_HELM1|nr:phosphoglycerate dehydrogenase [Helicobacter mustelae]CBG39417.1 D-3-phosphoglycerate dehydrogenase [Helicobacter mustelae 12198]SQH70930.1 D-3-phosphoglycerate dehydrogenase [Helicobacter mustelae]
MKVLVTDSINPCVESILRDVARVDLLPTMQEQELIKIIPNYDALMVRSQTKVTSAVIQHSKLKIIGRAGVGVDNIDIEAATQKGIIVTNSPDGNTIAAAEHTLGLIFALTRNIPLANASVQEGKWERSKFVGRELYGKTLGIVGFGRIGKHVGRVAVTLGMSLCVFDPYASQDIVQQEGGEYFTDLESFLKKCDYFTLHVPKTKETTHMINKDTLALMKKGAYIINASRGGIIDEIALRESIDAGHIGGAALDVFENEPDTQNFPLRGCPKAVLTPHLGASTEEAQLNVAIDVAGQIKSVLSGGTAQSAVNIPSLRADKLEPIKDYMPIAQNAGAFIAQLLQEKIESIAITAQGELASKNLESLEVAILKGILSAHFEDVNYVNAPLIAKQSGITHMIIQSSLPCNFPSLLSIKAKGKNAEHSISVSMVANIPKVLCLDEYETAFSIGQHTLLIPHQNKPAMIAKIAEILGSKHQININHMSVTQGKNGESLMLISTDVAIQNEVLEEIRQTDGIGKPSYIYLGPAQ